MQVVKCVPVNPNMSCFSWLHYYPLHCNSSIWVHSITHVTLSLTLLLLGVSWMRSSWRRLIKPCSSSFRMSKSCSMFSRSVFSCWSASVEEVSLSDAHCPDRPEVGRRLVPALAVRGVAPCKVSKLRIVSILVALSRSREAIMVFCRWSCC